METSDVVTLVGVVERDGEDARVSLSPSRNPRERLLAGVVQFDTKVSALVVDRQRGCPAGRVPRAGRRGARSAERAEVAELGVVAFRLEFGDHRDGQHDVVFRESAAWRVGSDRSTEVSTT